MTEVLEEEYALDMAEAITDLSTAVAINANQKGFWPNESPDVHIPRKLALVHAEVSEALELHHRLSDKVDLWNPKDGAPIEPFWYEFGEELADVIIRVLDIAGYYQLDIGQVIIDKHKKNLARPHKHGKRY